MIDILMIEDDREMADILSEYLAKYNIRITNYETPVLGLSQLRLKRYDAIILDLSLPDIDGIEVCRQIREKWETPIIISSARSDITDKAVCFSMGADDYLPKPYDTKELVMRINAILRRQNRTPSGKEKKLPFVLNEGRMEVLKNDEVLSLTNAEYSILAYFIKKNGYVISREELLMNVEAINYESSLKSIDVLISRLRHKIEDDPKKPTYIFSIRGVGYKMINE